MSMSEQFGSFASNVITEWDEQDHRTMTLVRDFSFVDPNGKAWHVPAGARIDGASVPWWLWSIIGSPFIGNYRNASVVHDHFSQLKNESWKDVHKLFHHACLAGGVNRQKAFIMYWAVYLFGPRWPDDNRQGADLLETFYQLLFPRLAGLT